MSIRNLLLLFMFFAAPAIAQYELPGTFSTSLKSIPSGSLVIAMDTNLQAAPGYFNMKAYGLADKLLENEIPVMWAIRKGKTKANTNSQIDFTSNSTRVYPDTGVAGTTVYYSGPFIIDSAWVSKAWPLIVSYGNNVRIYRLNVTTNVDVRYTLSFKPRICLLNLGGYDTITVKVLQEAGISSSAYVLRLPSNQIFNSTSQYSLLSEQHFFGNDTSRTNPVIRYVKNYGGNFVASCASIGGFENASLLMTSNGIDSATSGISAVAYFNIDLPTAQFHGNLITPNGDYKYWQLKSGSTFKTATSYQVVRSGNGTGFYLVTSSKQLPIGKPGGIITYLPGHSFFMNTSPGSINETVRINGRRIYMNHVFIPPGDSIATNLDFTTDVSIALQPQTGFAVKNETFTIYVIAGNNGPGRAKNITVNTPLVTGLNFVSYTSTKGFYNPATGIWLTDSLQKNKFDTLALTFTVMQIGNISISTSIKTESYEKYFPNNTTTLNLLGVSRPDAVRDSVLFNTPAYVDYNVKVNDTDEDGGPFSTVQILEGPYNGTAQQFGDTIRYYLGLGFSGRDSLLYLLCDQLPLCDSAWVYYYIPSPLPVTMGEFTGQRSSGTIRVQWNTLEEKDNDHFSLYRSLEGKNFIEATRINGTGNSTALKLYQWQEKDIYPEDLYYRLTQTDFNGKITFNGLIVLRSAKAGITFNIYPNPATDEFLLQTGSIENFAFFRLIDLTGRLVLEDKLTPDSNGNISKVISTSQLSKGIYITSLQSERGISSAKLILR